MSTSIAFALFFVLLSPILTAILLRFLRTRLSALPFYSIAGVLFGLAAVAAIWLVSQHQANVQLGSLVLIQQQGIDLEVPPEAEPTAMPTQVLPTLAATATRLAPTATTRPSATPTDQPTATTEATAEPTATSEPSTTPTAERRTYTVEDGDTLRSIAEAFDVTIAELLEANDLTPQQADQLQPGDVLIIP
ncbi:MAG: LysM peptidoglycan-binding domain-containing protein [Chloroflexi bacterium]|nr:LysM peptidoglycan-binding domain-containing protein [Chloroflexota bacterium]